MAMTPSQQQQRRLCINNGNNAIVTRATMPARRTMNNLCVLFSWPDQLFEQNRFVSTIPTG
jgi:hypothetical protein